MTPEVKKRIEQIRRGEVPEGYKRTKVGILPGEWEITKLNLISSHVTNKNTNGEVQTTFTNSATQGVIKQTDYFDKEISSRESITSYYIVQENDYIYNPRISVSAPCGPINKSHFPDNGVVSPLYTVFKMNDGLQENKYIEFYFKSSLWYKYMCGVANYGARHDRMNITNDDLFGMPIPFPPLAEQEKIAEILSAQDKLIELQQKKIEELKRLKKVYLSKLFPKKGCNVPEIRFPGFTDPWEQRKWSNTVDISTDMVDPKTGLYDELPHVAPGNIESFTGRLFDNVKLVKDENLISGKFRFSAGDIIYGKINPQLGKYVFAAFSGLTSADAYVLNAKNGIDQKFLYAVLQTKDFFDYSVSVSKRSGMPKINRDELNAYSFAAPSTAEQAKIGSFLLSIDNLITLHQRKLEEMKKLKKALMQLLLTGIVRV